MLPRVTITERTKLSNENKDIDKELKQLSTTLGGKRMKKSVVSSVRRNSAASSTWNVPFFTNAFAQTGRRLSGAAESKR